MTIAARWLLAWCLLAPGVPASEATPPPQHPNRTGWSLLNSWTQKQGLPQHSVTVILRSTDGYIWVGTKGGVAKFDGVQFTVLDDRTTGYLRENEIGALTEGADGSLWIGTWGGGVTRFKDGEFKLYTRRDGLVSDSVTALSCDQEGNIWIGTDAGLSRFEDGTFKNYSVADGFSYNAISSLFTDSEGAVWIGTNEGELLSYRRGIFKRYDFRNDKPTGRVRSISQDTSGNLWLAAGGLYQLTGDRIQRFTTRDGLVPDIVSSLHADNLGNVWVGTAKGLYRFKEGKFDFCAPTAGKNIVSIYGDNAGAVWFGSDGLNCVQEGRFLSYTTLNGLSYHYTTVVLEDPDLTVWVGTGRGLNRYRNGQFTAITTNHGLPENLVGALAMNEEGQMWVGTDAGLFRSEGRVLGADAPPLRFLPVKDPSLPNMRPRAMLIDRQGALWIGGNLEGLAYHKDGRWKVYTTEHGLVNNAVRGIAEDKEGNLWIATRGGLNRLRDGKFETFVTKDGLAGDVVEGLYLDREETLWLATRHGITRYKNGRFKVFTARDGLFSSFVYNFIEDDFGYLWMKCGKGVFQVKKQEFEDLAERKIDTITFFVYGPEHGLCTPTGTGGFQGGILQAADGCIWFTMTSGLCEVDPTGLPIVLPPPPVHLEAVEINQKPQPLRARVEAPPGHGDVEFHYTAINFLAPEKVRFRYRLIGHDRDWVDGGNRRTASYNSLQPGDYRFEVTAANADGIWNERFATFAFHLHPYWYQTWTVRFTGALLLIALMVGAYQLRIRQLRWQKQELETRVVERTAQLQAANKELEAFSYSVSHDLRAPLRSIDGFSKALMEDYGPKLEEEARENIRRVRRASQRMEVLIDDMLTLSRISRQEVHRTTIDLSNLARVITEELRAGDPGRRVQFIIPPELPVQADASLMRILLGNLLGNAWKYTSKHPTARIELGARQEGNQTIYFVRDDGAGFEMEFAGKLFGAFQRLHPPSEFPGTGIGLATVQRIIHRHGGRVWAESAVEKGATFYFTIG